MSDPGIQGKLLDAGQEQLTKDDYYTPREVFDALGLRFDLDVCAPPGGVPWIPCDRYFTLEEDGLTQPWEGRVWMNPPYSKATPWVRRFIEHGHGIALVGHAKSAWHPELWAKADACAYPFAYFDFVGGSIFMPVWFAAFGGGVRRGPPPGRHRQDKERRMTTCQPGPRPWPPIGKRVKVSHALNLRGMTGTVVAAATQAGMDVVVEFDDGGGFAEFRTWELGDE